MKLKYPLNRIYLLIGAILLVSCGKEEFALNPANSQIKRNPIQFSSDTSCALSTLIKPKVDFLFLWDNSSSQFLVDPNIKQAFNSTINLVSAEYDYRIVMAPLIGSGNANAFTVRSDDNGDPTPLPIIPSALAFNQLSSFPIAGASAEGGLTRTTELMNLNRTNGVFRSGVYTIVVLMSNGDDNSYFQGGFDSGPLREAYIAGRVAAMTSIRDQYNPLQFRFISLVAHSNCQTGWKENYLYKEFSNRMYIAPYSNGSPQPTDQAGRSTPDSFNICTTDFQNLFDGVNSIITPIVLNHVYNHWPVATNTDPSFDPGKITVSKSSGSTLIENDPNGFTFLGLQTGLNTRLLPTPGEPFTGFMIQLNGTGIVTYPDCLIVKTQTPADFYGYVHLPSNPVPNTIILKINGQTINQANLNDASPNGWQFVGYFDSLNVKILSASQPNSPGLPPELKTGYFLKLHGSAIHTNGATIEVSYDPVAN